MQDYLVMVTIFKFQLVLNLNEVPRLLTIDNPVKNLNFREVIVQSKSIKEYHLECEIY